MAASSGLRAAIVTRPWASTAISTSETIGPGNRRDASDEQLFIIIGDTGRRGVLQNLMDGPIGPGIDDDQFGGPEPDNAHLTGVVLRLNDDGSTPRDNPFYEFGASVGGEVGANLQKVFAYGIRNSFGIAVDPWTGELWESENCDDAFEEINRIEPATTAAGSRPWARSRVSRSSSRLKRRPSFSGCSNFAGHPTTLPILRSRRARAWSTFRALTMESRSSRGNTRVPTAAVGFLENRSLGREYLGDLFVGAATPALSGGHIFRFDLTKNRQRLAWSDPALADLVADNDAKHSIVESESLLFGTGFGVSTDIQTGPGGGLSWSHFLGQRLRNSSHGTRR